MEKIYYLSPDAVDEMDERPADLSDKEFIEKSCACFETVSGFVELFNLGDISDLGYLRLIKEEDKKE